MKTEMVMKLIEAGYSKADIDLMEETGKEKPAPETGKENPAPETGKEENPAPETDTNLQINELIGMVLKLQGTVDAMQKANAEKAESPKPEHLTTGKVLADFFGERKKP